MKNAIQGGQYCQMYDFGLQMVIFGPFQSLPPGGKKILTFQTWLRKSLVLPSWGQGAKLAWKMPFKGSIWPNVRFWPFSLYFPI